MDDKTLVERLDILIKDDHERGCQGRYYSCTCGYDNDCSQAMQDAKSHIEALEARLEIEPSHPYDGIYARDETIRLLEQRIEALEAALRDAAKAERDRIVAWLRGRSAPHSCRADKEIADALERQQ